MDDQLHLSSDQAAMVDPDYFWRPIDGNTPLGAKVQLINKDAGVAIYGSINSKESFFTHWAPLPKFRR
jgi:hypothetical protein